MGFPVPGSWVVVQSVEEVERALALEGAFSYLAVSAAAYFDFMERGVQCRSTHEFASRESTNEVASKNFGELHSLMLSLDNAVHEQFPDMPEGFKPFEAGESDFNKIVDSVSFALMEMTGFVRAESPSEILYWNDSQDHDRTKEQTVTSGLLDQRDWWVRLGIETRRIPGRSYTQVPSGSLGWRSRLRDFLNPNRTQGIRLLGWTLSSPIGRGDGPLLLVVGKSDNSMSFAKHAISTRRARVDWWTVSKHTPVHMPTLGRVSFNGASNGSSGVLDVLEGMIDLKMHSSWGHDQNRLPMGTIVQRRLLEYGTRIPQLWATYENSMDYFRSRRPSAVICGTADIVPIQTIRQAAKASGIPMASFQHGGAYGYMHSDWVTLSDLRADLYVGYGAHGSDYLDGLAKSRGLRARAFSIGWSRGRAIAGASKEQSQSNEPQVSDGPERRTDGPRVIMYVPTGLGGEQRHGPDHAYHDTEYCLEQVRVIEALRQVPDTIVVVKLHPKDMVENPLERWVRRLDDDRVKVLVGGRLPKTLAQTDLVVLDCPTTTLLEVMAMASRLVYLHLGILKWTPEGEALMRKSAPWVDVIPGWETRLGQAVVKALEEPVISPQANGFLEAYANLDFRPELVWHKLEEIRSAWARGSN